MWDEQTDWSAGISACNVAASAGSNGYDSTSRRFFVLRTHAGKDACAPVGSGRAVPSLGKKSSCVLTWENRKFLFLRDGHVVG